MTPPVFLVVGPVGHGKSTVREILCKLTYLKGASCSDVIYAFLAFRGNTTQEELRKIDKETFRPKLIEAGDFMVGNLAAISGEAHPVDKDIYRRPSALIRTLYQNGYNIIDGVRRRPELIEARDHLDWNGVRSLVLFVETPGKPVVADNSEELKDLADHVVLNDGTKEQLAEKIKTIVEKEFGVTDHTPVPVVSLKTGEVEAKATEGSVL